MFCGAFCAVLWWSAVVCGFQTYPRRRLPPTHGRLAETAVLHSSCGRGSHAHAVGSGRVLKFYMQIPAWGTFCQKVTYSRDRCKVPHIFRSGLHAPRTGYNTKKRDVAPRPRLRRYAGQRGPENGTPGENGTDVNHKWKIWKNCRV